MMKIPENLHNSNYEPSDAELEAFNSELSRPTSCINHKNVKMKINHWTNLYD